MPRSHIYAYIAVAAMVFILGGWGMVLIAEPDLHASYEDLIFSAYQGHIFVAVAVLTIIYRRWAMEKILWLSKEIHRWLSTLLMFIAIGAEGFMHTFNIPHTEGWWVPLVGGGVASASTLWANKFRKKHNHSKH